MKKIFLFCLAAVVFIISCGGPEINEGLVHKPRLIVTTDIGGDPDDQQSLVRLLVYSNEFDIEGLIASSSGTPGELGMDTVKDGLIKEYIRAYGEVLPALRLHSHDFPDEEFLLSRVKKGNPKRGRANIGPDNDTEASDWILKVLNKKDERPVNICIWGGQTDLAQALWKLKDSYSPTDYRRLINKIRIYDIADQDGLYEYIKMAHPGLFYILSKAPDGEDKREAAFRGMYFGGDESLTSLNWVNRNIRQDHGPLGELYPDETWTAPNPHGVLKEGDTPSWFYFLPGGLQDAQQPGWGGWGGRFEKDSASFYRDAADFAGSDIHARATVYRWREFFQNEFSARMDWCVNPPELANHSPIIKINGKIYNEPFVITASEGQFLSIDAAASADPEGDELDFYWWTYPEAGTNNVCPELENYLSPVVSLEIPEGESGNEIHLICQVEDRGDPVLASCQRIVIRVK